jgi:outer membrane protein assembly factor BamB
MTLRLTCILALAAAPLMADDWPQWRGPDRTGLSKETGLLKEWPKDGTKQVWKITGLGDGYSTPSVAAGRIYLLGTKDNDEYVICLKEADGSKVWEAKIGPKNSGRSYPGVRSTPTIDRGHAYAVGSDGILVCVEIEEGKEKWRTAYKKDFGGQHGSWAYAESPLVDGDLVIGTPGSDTAALVAFKRLTGEVVWKASVAGISRKPAGENKGGKGGKGGNRAPRSYGVAGYSSAQATELGGVKQYVQFIDGGVIGVSAKDGKLLWHYEEPASEGANISTPVIHDSFVFAASAYGTGGGLAKIVERAGGLKAEPQYFNARLQNHHGGFVLVKDHMYMTTGSLLCVDFKTGKIVWDDRSVGKGSVTYADGHLYVRGENGKVALVEANPAKYVEKGQFAQPDRSKQAAWPHPVVANGKLYLRDWDALFCYDVKNK